MDVARSENLSGWRLFKCLLVTAVMAAAALMCGVGVARADVWEASASYNCSAGSRWVNAVYVDLNDPDIHVEMALAKGQIGAIDTLDGIAGQLWTQDREVAAAINGTFFNAYVESGPQLPFGNIQIQGRYVHQSNVGTSMAFTADNQVCMGQLTMAIDGYRNGKRTWYAWWINHIDSDPRSIVICTPENGPSTGYVDKPTVTVRNGRVTAKGWGDTPIPSDGFVIVCGENNIDDQFSVGDSADYKLRPTMAGSWPADTWTTIGVGPTLVRNGTISVDPAGEGLTEPEILSESTMWSFAGVTDSNVLVLATCADINAYQAAELASAMGLMNAMGLDGGDSSGLYYGGNYLTQPGRLISNALVITRQAAPPIGLSVNGKAVVSDVPPQLSGDRVMVPLRIVSESLGADVDWDSATQSVTITGLGRTITLVLGDSRASVNGTPYTLDAAPYESQGRTMVPVRFIAEALGASVNWDEGRNTVYIVMN